MDAPPLPPARKRRVHAGAITPRQEPAPLVQVGEGNGLSRRDGVILRA